MHRPDDWGLTERLHAPTGKGDPFAAAVRATRMPMLITDPRQDDNPIVFVNDAFLKMTRYERADVMGRNCRLLQGEGTDPASVTAIREAVRAKEDLSIEILNYRKDGSEFWNALYMSPVSGEDGELLFFFASQLDVTERKSAELAIRADHARVEKAVEERTRELTSSLREQTELVHEIDHRVKNNLQTILALIRIGQLEGRAADPKRAMLTLQRRVEALAGVHRKIYREGGQSGFDLAAYLTEFVESTERVRPVMKLDTDRAPVRLQYAAPVALIASEFANIAQDHVAKNPEADLTLTVKQISPSHYRCCLSGQKGASKIVADVEQSARTFIDMLAPQLGAAVEWGDYADRNRICIEIPADLVGGAGNE